MTLNFIDISGNNPGINLAGVPCDAVAIKATGSGNFVSSACDGQFQQAKQLGKLRAIYDYLRDLGGPAGDPIQRADFFVDNTAGYFDGMTIPVLDWESVIPGDPIVRNVAWALAWLTRVYNRTGIRPWIYMSNSLTVEVDWSPVVNANFGLWVSAYVLGQQPIYGYNPPQGLRTPGYWGGQAAWQYTDRGQLPGYNGNLDLNVFYGDRAAWLKYATKQGTKPITPAPVKPGPVKPAPVTPAPKPVPSGGGTYTVKPNDNLTLIAARFGTTVDALVRLNGIGNPDYIQAGLVLRLPVAAAPKPVPKPAPVAKPSTYTVKPNDNLTAIAARFGTTVDALVRLNGIGNPDYIQAGQTLKLR